MEKRYSSIDELVADFDEAAEPGILDRLRKNWRSIAAATILGAGLVGLAGIPAYDSIKRAHQAEQAESEKYEVVAAVDGIDLEIRNNLFDMSVSAFNTSLPDKPIPTYPESLKVVKAKPGDRIYAYAKLVSKPLPKRKIHQWGIPMLEGRIYLEGTEGETIRISPRSPNGAITYDMGTYEDNSASFNLPNNIKPGNYNLVTEFYSPDAITEDVEKANLKFSKLGKIIARKSVPISVGEDTLPFGFSELRLEGYSNTVYFNSFNHGRSNEPGIKSIVEVIGGERNEREGSSVKFDLPHTREGYHRMLKMSLEHNGSIIHEVVAPVRCWESKLGYWEYELPDKNFYQTLQKVAPLRLNQ